jgi:hypothetical protein
MGMFDWFRSSYDLGEEFTETTCQSKTFNEEYRGFLDLYWLDPSGNLWKIYDEDMYDVLESDEALLGLEWIRNDKHGKVSPCRISQTVLVYPANYPGRWEDWPECALTFLNGKLQHYEARPRPVPPHWISYSPGVSGPTGT